MIQCNKCHCLQSVYWEHKEAIAVSKAARKDWKVEVTFEQILFSSVFPNPVRVSIRWCSVSKMPEVSALYKTPLKLLFLSLVLTLSQPVIHCFVYISLSSSS